MNNKDKTFDYPRYSPDTIDQMELRLLAHHPQVDRIQLGTVKSIVWRPWTPAKIGDHLPQDLNAAFAAWTEEMDEAQSWCMNDPAQFLSFDQAVLQPWCQAHKINWALTRFLRGIDFPRRFIESEQISEKAYLHAVEVQATHERVRHKERMQGVRNPQVTE